MIDQNGRIFDQSGRIIDQLIDQNGGQIMAQEMAPDLGNVIDASSLIHSQQISQQETEYFMPGLSIIFLKEILEIFNFCFLISKKTLNL